MSIGLLINRAGTMVLPFLSLYFTVELGFSKPQAGLLLALYGVGDFGHGYWRITTPSPCPPA